MLGSKLLCTTCLEALQNKENVGYENRVVGLWNTAVVIFAPSTAATV